MQLEFIRHIDENKLCSADDTIILAVSGGVDSVVMTDLFYKSGYSCMILHCNFGLRGRESDEDEAFVRRLAASCEYPVFVKAFETEEYATVNGISIQMAARELRYRWFDEMADLHKVKHIATAHNLNDSVETFFLNLSRGTGIRGLTGIPLVNDRYIRPILFASRREIQAYGIEKQIAYREDSSNSSKKYKRNKIRHDVIPALEELNSSFLSTMQENMIRIGESRDIYTKEINRVRDTLFKKTKEFFEIDLLQLQKLDPLSTWLYELFSPYGFTSDQCLNMQRILNAGSGKQFISSTHRLYKDRERLLLFKNEEKGFDHYYIDSPDKEALLPFPMDMELMDREELISFPATSDIACLDIEKLNFPLLIRKWQHGDYFYPLGMDQMKKISDFFIDEKVPVPVKKKTWILVSGNKVAWVMGHRIDNRFKLDPSSKKVLKLQLYK